MQDCTSWKHYKTISSASDIYMKLMEERINFVSNITVLHSGLKQL